MIQPSEVSILIPAYNEEESIGAVIDRLKQLSDDLEIIVCSDGSTDRTAEVSKEKGAVVVEHAYNLGNGASVKSAAKKATRPYLLVMDADLQHPPEEIYKLFDHMPKYDMVIAARTNKCDTLLIRDVGNFLLKKTATFLSGHEIPDLTSGFRLIKRALYFRFEHLYPLGYSYPTTITLAALLTGSFVQFVPMDNIVKRSKGRSNIRPIREGLRFLNIILRIVMTFQPQKIFLPISFFTIALGITVGGFQIYYTRGIQSTALILILIGVLLFLNGLLASQLSNIALSLGKTKETKAEDD